MAAYTTLTTPNEGNITVHYPHDEFHTKNRALEQFLYARRIRPDGWFKDANNFTVWRYRKTDELMETVNLYAHMQVFGTGWRENRDGYAKGN